MKLYEFVFRKGVITKHEHEVKETEKLYTSQKDTFQYNSLLRLPKSRINMVLDDGYWGMFYISTEDNIELARVAFIDFYRERKIPRCKQAIEKEKRKLINTENELNALISNKTPLDTDKLPCKS